MVAFARGTEAQMVAARNMHQKSKGKLNGVPMSIEYDSTDYPFAGKDEPALGIKR